MKFWMPLFLLTVCAFAGKFERFVAEKIPEGARVLQFGTHPHSAWLSKHYELITVESRIERINECDSEYVFAPLTRGWYDRDAIEKFMPTDYDCILINEGEHQIEILENLDLINTKAPILITKDHFLADELGAILCRPVTASDDNIQ